MLYELSGSAADSKDIRSAEVKSGPGITPIYFGTHSKAVKIKIKSVKMEPNCNTISQGL